MNIYDFTVKDNKGNEVSLKKYENKVLLVVNTATGCGLTPQYEALEKMYQELNKEGFEILDFPSNQFLHQAPGTDEEIQEFCTLTYNTTFPRFSKIDVNGDTAIPLYKWLKEEQPVDKTDAKSKLLDITTKPLTLGNAKEDIKWNFGKFLIDKQGNVVDRYAPGYVPEKLEAEIKDLLAK
ncbi:glutathione peroxidase [Mycoplasma sp. P36-A1]|uniref:glutathione peroxidase n=1 Tax=Mycoplasma sp. P36-A1 TaxID=3252900 RepID=UPI003C2D0519